MRIVASSLMDRATAFLHAGYISATPSGQAAHHPMLYGATDPGYSTGLDGALATTPVADALPAMAAAPGWIDLMYGWPGAIILVGAAILVAAVLPRQAGRPRRSPIWAPTTGLLLLLSVSWFVGACLDEELSGDDDDTVAGLHLEFVDPQTATMAIGHVLLKEALVDHHIDGYEPIADLAELESYLALPGDERTAGMEHAVETFTLDGWGQPWVFELDIHDDEVLGYVLTSVGEDGVLNTQDDIVIGIDFYSIDMSILPTPDEYLEGRTFYLQRLDDTLWILIRYRDYPDSQEHQERWDGQDTGGLVDGQYWGLPLTVEFLQDYWAMLEGNDDFLFWHMGLVEEPAWDATIAAMEQFYDQFITEDLFDPIVVQVYDSFPPIAP